MNAANQPDLWFTLGTQGLGTACHGTRGCSSVPGRHTADSCWVASEQVGSISLEEIQVEGVEAGKAWVVGWVNWNPSSSPLRVKEAVLLRVWWISSLSSHTPAFFVSEERNQGKEGLWHLGAGTPFIVTLLSWDQAPLFAGPEVKWKWSTPCSYFWRISWKSKQQRSMSLSLGRL